MPLYNFALHDGDYATEDEGMWLPDRERALQHAHHVARELMHARESQTRTWRIDIYEGGRQIDGVPFARLDPTLDHLQPRVRAEIEVSCESIHSMRQMVSTTKATVRESRALLARSRGRPYLAVVRGQPTIRATRHAGKSGGEGFKGGNEES